jgi:hypothetical protein
VFLYMGVSEYHAASVLGKSMGICTGWKESSHETQGEKVRGTPDIMGSRRAHFRGDIFYRNRWEI